MGRVMLLCKGTSGRFFPEADNRTCLLAYKKFFNQSSLKATGLFLPLGFPDSPRKESDRPRVCGSNKSPDFKVDVIGPHRTHPFSVNPDWVSPGEFPLQTEGWGRLGKTQGILTWLAFRTKKPLKPCKKPSPSPALYLLPYLILKRNLSHATTLCTLAAHLGICKELCKDAPVSFVPLCKGSSSALHMAWHNLPALINLF